MRATSSGMGYCILYAIRLRLEIKELAELLGEKTGRNSLTLKKLLGGIFR
jgi:predicted DNA-binding protein